MDSTSQEWLKNLSELIEKSREVIQFINEKQLKQLPDYANNLEPFKELNGLLFEKYMQNPQEVIDAQIAFWKDYTELLQQTTLYNLGKDDIEPMFKAEPKDKRFLHESWSLPGFNFIKQFYLLLNQHIQNFIEQMDSVDPATHQRITFFVRTYLNSLAPSNFVASNPEILQLTLDSKGENLLKGLNHFYEDLKTSDGPFNIKLTDHESFKIGENIAVTPGKVVYQNDLIQLIQYEPTTEKVLKRPLLIVPPWINKYYILDLTPKNSLVKWAVDQGHTVFIISWRNPDTRHRYFNFEDYMVLGILSALDAIEQATGESGINGLGFCIGGTLLACALAYLAKHNQQRILSATYLTTMIDFSEPGELGVFMSEEQIKHTEGQMAEKGYLDGRSMAQTFNLLKDNDLIWSYFINNYLAGKEPLPFDLLYWNSDGSNLPEQAHRFYLRNMYLKNLLSKPNALTLADTALNIRDIKIPAYFISTELDHIAPWKSTYKGAQLHSGTVRFVLGGSGHIAGVVNPPYKMKYGYWTNPTLEYSSEEWLSNAKQQKGSWWTDWDSWIKKQDSNFVTARKPGEGKLSIIEDAPGSYVKRQLNEDTHE